MPPSFPMIGIEYFGVKRAVMCSETSLQTLTILISLRHIASASVVWPKDHLRSLFDLSKTKIHKKSRFIYLFI